MTVYVIKATTALVNLQSHIKIKTYKNADFVKSHQADAEANSDRMVKYVKKTHLSPPFNTLLPQQFIAFDPITILSHHYSR